MNVAATYTSSPQNINHNSQIVHNQNYIVGSTVPRNSQSQTRVTFKSMPHAIQSQPIHPIYFAQTQPQVGQYGAPIPIQHRAQCSTFCPMHGQNNFVPMQRPVQVVRMSSMVTPTPPPPSPPPPTEPKPVETVDELFGCEDTNHLCDVPLEESSVYCIICNTEYKTSEKESHIQKHMRKPTPTSTIVTTLFDSLIKSKHSLENKPYKTKPIVEPEEYNVAYRPNEHKLLQIVNFSNVEQPISKDIQVGDDEVLPAFRKIILQEQEIKMEEICEVVKETESKPIKVSSAVPQSELEPQHLPEPKSEIKPDTIHTRLPIFLPLKEESSYIYQRDESLHVLQAIPSEVDYNRKSTAPPREEFVPTANKPTHSINLNPNPPNPQRVRESMIHPIGYQNQSFDMEPIIPPMPVQKAEPKPEPEHKKEQPKTSQAPPKTQEEPPPKTQEQSPAEKTKSAPAPAPAPAPVPIIVTEHFPPIDPIPKINPSIYRQSVNPQLREEPPITIKVNQKLKSVQSMEPIPIITPSLKNEQAVLEKIPQPNTTTVEAKKETTSQSSMNSAKPVIVNEPEIKTVSQPPEIKTGSQPPSQQSSQAVSQSVEETQPQTHTQTLNEPKPEPITNTHTANQTEPKTGSNALNSNTNQPQLPSNTQTANQPQPQPPSNTQPPTQLQSESAPQVTPKSESQPPQPSQIDQSNVSPYQNPIPSQSTIQLIPSTKTIPPPANRSTLLPPNIKKKLPSRSEW